jgi:hypothetical protein
MKDLFGNEVTEDEVRALLRRGAVGQPNKRRDPTPAGYAAPPGTGPDGETCRTCEHRVSVPLAKIYHKCALKRAEWTGGRKTDILVRSPACRLWEAG